MKKLWQLPFYAWLIAVYPIASIAARNPGQAEGKWIAAVIALALVAASLLAVVHRAISGSWHRASVGVVMTTLVFYGYGPVRGLVDAWLLDLPDGADAGFMAKNAVSLLMIASVLLLAAGVVASFLVRDALARRVAAPLNTVASLLIAFAVAQAVSVRGSPPPAGLAGSEVAPATGVSAEHPDVYVIILDGYARRDVLSTYYGFDNSPFFAELENLGFSVVDGGNSNYAWTHLSLASSLNMNYLPEVIEGPILPGSQDRSGSYEAIRDSEAARFLRGQGYEFVQLQSSWGATKSNPNADVFLPCSSSALADEFVRAVVEASWLRAIDASETLAECHLTNFETLATLGTHAGPKFVLAHFVLPHHPYLFDREGTVLSDATIANQFDFQAKLWEDRARYAEQLSFVNQAVVAAVARIIETSARPPVILVHSDHGPNLVNGLPEDEQLRVRFANFAAIHAPGVEGHLMPHGETPVNYFRRIFNEYFHAGLPILEGRHYASTYGLPFKFTDVTQVVSPTDLSLEGI
jgi:hypothetical protein